MRSNLRHIYGHWSRRDYRQGKLWQHRSRPRHAWELINTMSICRGSTTKGNLCETGWDHNYIKSVMFNSFLFAKNWKITQYIASLWLYFYSLVFPMFIYIYYFSVIKLNPKIKGIENFNIRSAGKELQQKVKLFYLYIQIFFRLYTFY